MKKRFLFNWIALDAGNVAPGDVEAAAGVEADLADACLAFEDGAVVTAGVTADSALIERLPELARAGVFGEDFYHTPRIGCHRTPGFGGGH
jgi:hypothetical protein